MSNDDFTTIAAAVAGKFTDDNCRPRFHLKSVEITSESEKAGRPVFRDIEYVEIHIPGDRKSTVDRKVRDEDKRRWPQHYAAWKANQELPSDGMPLEKWTLISPSEIDNFKYGHVRTVEQLAGLSDTQLQTFGPGSRKLRETAKAWLKQAGDNAGLSKMAAENDRLRDDLASTRNQLDSVLKRLAKLEAGDDDDTPAPRKRKPRATVPAHEMPEDEA